MAIERLRAAAPQRQPAESEIVSDRLIAATQAAD
jgi:hypothetical protein